MIHHLLRRLIDHLARSLDSGRAWDATAASPELVARLGPYKPPAEYERCAGCGTFVRGAHQCPIYLAEPNAVVPITRRKRSRIAS